MGYQSDGRPASSPQPAIRIAATIGISSSPVAIPLIGANLAFAMLEASGSLILAQQAEYYPITKAIYTLLSTLGNGTELAAALGIRAMVFTEC